MQQGKEREGWRGWGGGTWIPAVVCVLEQVNSLYSRIAITSTLQQGCSWLELKAAWPDQTGGLFFFFSLPFLLKCRYERLPRRRPSRRFGTTFPKCFSPHTRARARAQTQTHNIVASSCRSKLVQVQNAINQIMLKDGGGKQLRHKKSNDAP